MDWSDRCGWAAGKSDLSAVMNVMENVRLALRNVRGNLLRTILTLLIIAFGIMALVGILTAIDSAIYALNDNFSQVGANSFSVLPGADDLGGQRRGRRVRSAEVITYEEADRFKDRMGTSARVSLRLTATSVAELRYQEEKTNPNVVVLGIDENYLDVFGFDISGGRNISPAEIRYAQNKALVGQDIVQSLFGGEASKAIGKTIRIGNLPFMVVGVLASKGASMNQNSDRQVFIPLLAAKQYYGSSRSNYEITVQVDRAEQMQEAIEAATGLMRQVRGLRISQPNDFRIVKSDSLLEIIRENTVTLRLAAVAIGLMTLLGAAIGLMNIMLVSVTERTREVGICKALGATRRNVLLQFLVEAIVICQLGGIVGIILGILIGNVVTILMEGSFLVPWDWILLGFVVCLVTGLISGLYPAMKAAQLDPIESLRHEG